MVKRGIGTSSEERAGDDTIVACGRGLNNEALKDVNVNPASGGQPDRHDTMLQSLEPLLEKQANESTLGEEGE